jgi:hypothetical protein
MWLGEFVWTFATANITQDREELAHFRAQVEGEEQRIQRTVASLEPNDLWVMAMENDSEVLGPFHHQGRGYSYLSWADARVSVSKLVQLGLIQTSTEPGEVGTYRWTAFGRIILGRLDPQFRELEKRGPPN